MKKIKKIAQMIIKAFKGDLDKAYEHCLSYSVPREDDYVFEFFGYNIESTREHYKNVAAYIKSLM